MRWLASAACFVLLAATSVQQTGTAEKQRIEQQDQPNPQPPVTGTIAATQTDQTPQTDITGSGKKDQAAARVRESRKEYPFVTWLSDFKIGDAINLVMVLFTGAFLFYTICMWREMVRQNVNAEKAYEDGARETEESLRLTRESNDATLRAVSAAEQQQQVFAGVLRAWLNMTKLWEWNYRVNAPDVVLVEFTNTGYSPALAVHPHGRMVVAKSLELVDFSCTCGDDGEHKAISSLPVGAGRTVKFEIAGLVLSADEIEAVACGESFVYIHGHVDYADVFGNRRRTSYAACYEVGPGYWSAAAKNNEQT